METNYLNELNPEQRKAVETTNGPLLIIAGAGTGKTKTLTYRMLHLINSGIQGDHILGITFTNKAAKEMRERMQHIIPAGSQLPMLGTFHSVCSSFLRKHADLAGYYKTFTIIDTDDQISISKILSMDSISR